MTTVKEVAMKVNLSPSTVSRVLNGDHTFSVTEQTRARILHAAKQLGYRSKRQKTDKVRKTSLLNVGLVQFWGVQEQYWDQFYVSIRAGVELEFSKFDVDISQGLRTFYGNGPVYAGLGEFDGLIVIGENSCFSAESYLGTENIVLVDSVPNSSHYDSVLVDYFKATQDSMKYLFDLGHREIGFIGGETEAQRPNERWVAYERFMMERGLFKQEYTEIGGWTTNDGYMMMKRILDRHMQPTAFFVASDALAIGVMRALDESGLSVPGDVSVLGFNDLELARFLNPPLSTTKVHTEFMGELAVRLLIDRINGRNVPLKVTVPTELMVRESCRSLY